MEVNLFKMMKIDTLRHRDTAKKVIEIVSNISSEEEIVIDFSGIVFASRSFCHELRNGLKGRQVIFKNTLPEIDEMIQLVLMKPKIETRNSFKHKKLELIAS